MSGANGKTPWKDGYWGSDGPKEYLDNGNILTVKGSVVIGMSMTEFVHYYARSEKPEKPEKTERWTFGEFGKASKELENFSHFTLCNLKMSLDYGRFGGTIIIHGILHPDGTKCCFQMGGSKNVYGLRWLDENDIKQIFDSVEPLWMRSHPFKVQPENQGKLIFLSGPPFSGKSKIAPKVAQAKDFVFYDGINGFSDFMNPYPRTCKESKRPWVRGWSKKDFEIIFGIFRIFKLHQIELPKCDLTNQKSYSPFFKLMAKDVVSEKKKIGGDWIVTCDVATRKLRDVIKKECNATFIVLTPSPETQKKSSKDNCSGKLEFWRSLQKQYERVQQDEEDAYEVFITSEMEKDEVVQNVLDLIELRVDKTKPKRIDNLPFIKRQTRELRLPKIHPKYQPNLGEVRAISGRSIGGEVSYTV